MTYLLNPFRFAGGTFDLTTVPGFVGFWDVNDETDFTLVDTGGGVMRVDAWAENTGIGKTLNRTVGTPIREAAGSGTGSWVNTGFSSILACDGTTAFWQFLHQQPSFYAMLVQVTNAANQSIFVTAGSSNFRGQALWGTTSGPQSQIWKASFGNENSINTHTTVPSNTFGVFSAESDPANATPANRSYLAWNDGSRVNNNVETNAYATGAPEYTLRIGTGPLNSNSSKIGSFVFYDQVPSTEDQSSIITFLLDNAGL